MFFYSSRSMRVRIHWEIIMNYVSFPTLCNGWTNGDVLNCNLILNLISNV